MIYCETLKYGGTNPQCGISFYCVVMIDDCDDCSLAEVILI